MKTQILGIEPEYTPDNDLVKVVVRIRAEDPEDLWAVTGRVRLSADEYEGNEALNVLEGVIRSKIGNKILGTGE